MEYPKDHFVGLFFIICINVLVTILKDAVNINLNLYADDISRRIPTIYGDNNELLTIPI